MQMRARRRKCQSADRGILLKWFKFTAGLAALALVVLLLSSGYSPPGVAGEVLRHNQREQIDASALFYTEVENMSELEDDLRRMIREKRISRTETVRSSVH